MKILGNENDQDQALASLKASEGRSFDGFYTNSIVLSTRGDYLCMYEKPDSDDAASKAEDNFVVYETQNWQEQARCKADENIDRMLGLTADGTHVIWQAENPDNAGTGIIYTTDTASGQTEVLEGLSTSADAHYAASTFDATDGSLLVAVLSCGGGKDQRYTARLYRDGHCAAEMALPLEREGEHVVFNPLKRTTPLALSASGMLAFGYRPDKTTAVDVFANMADQTVCTAKSPTAANDPSYACLSQDGTRYASADSDGVVRIRDTRDGSLMCSYTPDRGVRGLAFIADDDQLALYTDDYRLLAIDASNGELVSETPNVRSKTYEAYQKPRCDWFEYALQRTEEMLSISNDYHDISIYETEHDLILCTALGEGCIIDRESMAVREYVPGIMGYSASADAVLVYGAGILAYPVFSVEDLVAKGEELLSGNSASGT